MNQLPYFFIFTSASDESLLASVPCSILTIFMAKASQNILVFVIVQMKLWIALMHQTLPRPIANHC